MIKISLEDVKSKIHQMRSFSPIAIELLESISKEDVDRAQIVKRIALDQVLTAKTLRLANSSFYGLSYKVSSIDEAVVILGFYSIQTLTNATLIIANLSDETVDSTYLNSFWLHSISTAICAKQLAKLCKFDQNLAFTTGLLHDIGKLILATQFQTQYLQVDEYQKTHHCSRIVAELEILGITHSEVARLITAHWKFPVEIQTAVGSHHDEINISSSKLTQLVCVANNLAHHIDSENDKLFAPVISPSIYQNLNLSPEVCEELIGEAKEQCAEVFNILLN